MDIELVSPLPPEYYSLVWRWLGEHPANNQDDFSPKTYAGFQVDMDLRQEREDVFLVLSDGKPVGAIGFCPMTPHAGMLHGILFSKSVHGTGVAKRAMQMLMEKLFASGLQKISASYYQHNARVGRFLEKLGFRVEGLMVDQTLQDGRAVSMVLVAAFAS